MAEKIEKKVKRRNLRRADRIRLLVKDNPKREGTRSFKQFALYRDGETWGEARKRGVRAGDVAWDAIHGFIRIEMAPDKPKPGDDEEERAEPAAA